MKQDLVRFGVAIEPELLKELDALATARGCTRSELLRDLARNEVARSVTRERVPAVAAVTLVYNHHVRMLSERLTEIQHGLGEQVRSTMHVHLDHENCLEVIVLRGHSDELRAAADRMLGTRGVTHGGIELVSESALTSSRSHRHTHEHAEHGGHEHAHEHGQVPKPAKRTAKKQTLATPPRRPASRPAAAPRRRPKARK